MGLSHRFWKGYGGNNDVTFVVHYFYFSVMVDAGESGGLEKRMKKKGTKKFFFFSEVRGFLCFSSAIDLSPFCVLLVTWGFLLW